MQKDKIQSIWNIHKENMQIWLQKVITYELTAKIQNKIINQEKIT